MSLFLARYLYGWLACYFNAHYVLDLALAGPLMVHYSGFGGQRVLMTLEGVSMKGRLLIWVAPC